MRFVKSVKPAAAAISLISAGIPTSLDISSPTSVQSVAKTIAQNTMSFYKGTDDQFVDLDAPYYWWQCGAMMGSMLDYSHYTGDHTYDKKIATAIVAQAGPDFDFMSPAHAGQEGNDDQAFWGFTVLAAAERNFPQPRSDIPGYLELGENIWKSLASRWDTSTCNGGLRWQIFASNPNGLDYKNAVSNGGFFQLSARLARITGNQTYVEWANKVWDWTQGTGIINEYYQVLDGASSAKNCSDVSAAHTPSFSYSQGIYTYGAAVMANISTGADQDKWTDRTKRLLESSQNYFTPFGDVKNSTDVMYEHACEHIDICNTDMRSFKGYFSRFVYASKIMVPSIKPTVDRLLHTSAKAAAQGCQGGSQGTMCGTKWYVDGFYGDAGLGEQMSALETIQGILIDQANPPLKGGDIKTVRTFSSSS
ncbi:mannan endo-1,6-alpha-mannosidase [Neurospora hispaniola]|uniref:Mannan endo-1,6-alpha-mannosidase n=1 Tax=Neurospora hispaniola TaxID=588809 RepID=A0AAJ0MMK8_9PEZI|nr:mannan endo-1,6-alpha-mannosidase [Neurospora hispaniola]